MFELKKLVVIVSGVLVLTACGSSVKLDESTPTETPAATNTQQQVAAPVDPLNDPNSKLAQRSVYFDFDSYVIKSEYKSLVEAHASYLSSRKDRKVVIQGNTDERGGREYNLALGQKRSEAVRKAMSLMGVSDDQMEAISFGEEKPKATGSNEEAWAENRRADIVYQ